jgi:hypothetical protein
MTIRQLFEAFGQDGEWKKLADACTIKMRDLILTPYGDTQASQLTEERMHEMLQESGYGPEMTVPVESCVRHMMLWAGIWQKKRGSVFRKKTTKKEDTDMKEPSVYCLTLSQTFPTTHPRAGQPTFFFDKLNAAISGNLDYWNKLHTIRANYDFWAKRFQKIKAGEAVLSIREWVGTPYGKGSTQRELARLTRKDGIGIQKLEFELADKSFGKYHPRINDGKGVSSIEELAKNDGLSLEDWKAWFKDYDLSKPMAIIHFTKFRY